MRRPRFLIDFNELIEKDLVGLSRGDTELTADGETILLREGLAIDVFDKDRNEKGEPDNLVASGVVERNSTAGWGKHIKWCCRIDDKGIRHESDLK